MALPPRLLDDIGRFTTPTFSEPVTRIFIFDTFESAPGFVIVYTAKSGKPFIRAVSTFSSYTPSPRPRREPSTITTTSGEQWSFQKGGCGCGSPIRRVTLRQALDDYAAQAAPVS